MNVRNKLKTVLLFLNFKTIRLAIDEIV